MTTVPIYRSKQFTKQLDRLWQAGGKARLAARQAHGIIEALALRTPLPEAGSLTKHGELRLKKGRKFDLGSGYRLLTMVRNGQVVLLYVGTHDDCNQWLENNRGLAPETAPEPAAAGPAHPVGEGPETSHKEPDQERDGQDDYDRYLYARLNERLLRCIFKGLCGG